MAADDQLMALGPTVCGQFCYMTVSSGSHSEQVPLNKHSYIPWKSLSYRSLKLAKLCALGSQMTYTVYLRTLLCDIWPATALAVGPYHIRGHLSMIEKHLDSLFIFIWQAFLHLKPRKGFFGWGPSMGINVSSSLRSREGLTLPRHFSGFFPLAGLIIRELQHNSEN